jgi:O-antigen ligase
MEWGWAGASAWVLLLGGGFFKALVATRDRSDESLLAAAAALALAGVMIHALMDFPLQIASLQLFTLVIAGLCWGLPKPLHPHLRHHRFNA